MSAVALLIIGLWKRRSRTALMLACIAIVFFNYGLFFQMYYAIQYANGPAAEFRVTTTSRTGLVELMPKSHAERIAKVDGVRLVSYGTFFHSYYRAPGNHLAAYRTRDTDLTIYAVDPGSWMDTYGEWVIPPGQRTRFLSEPDGLLVGEGLARMFGWKVGDRVTLTTTRSIHRQRNGSTEWPFVISGIFSGNGPNVAVFWGVFHHDYFDSLRQTGAGQIGVIQTTVYDARDSVTVTRAIDAAFENTEAPTRTFVTNEFFRNFFRQGFNFGLMAFAATSIALIAFLLVVGTSMATAIFERRKEIAILRTIGFSRAYLRRLVFGESVCLGLVGGLCGLLLAALFLNYLKAPRALVLLQADVLGPALLVMVAFGFAIGVVPALMAGRVGTRRPLTQE